MTIHVKVPGSVEEQILRVSGCRPRGMSIDEASVSQCFERLFRAEIASAYPTRFANDVGPERPPPAEGSDLENKAAQSIPFSLGGNRKLSKSLILFRSEWDFPLSNPHSSVIFVDPVIEGSQSRPDRIVVPSFQDTQAAIRHRDHDPRVPGFTSHSDAIQERPESIGIAEQ
jgi:hypothetical protein